MSLHRAFTWSFLHSSNHKVNNRFGVSIKKTSVKKSFFKLTPEKNTFRPSSSATQHEIKKTYPKFLLYTFFVSAQVLNCNLLPINDPGGFLNALYNLLRLLSKANFTQKNKLKVRNFKNNFSWCSPESQEHSAPPRTANFLLRQTTNFQDVFKLFFHKNKSYGGLFP